MTTSNYSLNIEAISTTIPTTTRLPILANKEDIWPWRIGLFGVGGACIACVGVVCNCITIIVLVNYKTSQTRSWAPCLLICLEVCDTIYLVFQLFLENLSYISQGGLISGSYLTFIKPIYCVTYAIPHIAWTSSTFLVVVITLERCVVVAWPLSAHIICRPTYVKLAVVVVVLMAVFFHTPLLMAFRCTKEWNNATKTENLKLIRSEFGSSYYFMRVHMTWLKLIVNFLIPFLLLITFNTLLLRVLWLGRSSILDATQRTNRNEKKLTAMVICMTGVFFVCELMSAVSFILTSGIDAFVQCSDECNRLSAVADTMVMVNAAVNFGIYCASGKKFRNIFCQIILRRNVALHSSTCCSTPLSTKDKTKCISLLRWYRHSNNSAVNSALSSGIHTSPTHLRKTSSNHM